MNARPKYDLIEAATVAAHETYQLLDGKYNADVVLWEILEINRIRNVGGYIAMLINEIGRDGYQKIRGEIVATVDPKE